MQYCFYKGALVSFKCVKNTALPLPSFVDKETEVQRHKGVCSRSPGSSGRGSQDFWALFQNSFASMLTFLPRHTTGVFWNLPSLGPCFSIWSNFWEKEMEPVACAPSPQLSKALCAKFHGHSTVLLWAHLSASGSQAVPSFLSCGGLAFLSLNAPVAF